MQVKPVRKLGFREKDEYMKLEKQIEDATEEKEQLEAKIAETAQSGDFQAVAELTRKLPALAEKIDKMTDRYAYMR
jgi:predicted  nucleic acid-binding Zn-ribbon protein